MGPVPLSEDVELRLEVSKVNGAEPERCVCAFGRSELPVAQDSCVCGKLDVFMEKKEHFFALNYLGPHFHTLLGTFIT